MQCAFPIIPRTASVHPRTFSLHPSTLSVSCYCSCVVYLPHSLSRFFIFVLIFHLVTFKCMLPVLSIQNTADLVQPPYRRRAVPASPIFVWAGVAPVDRSSQSARANDAPRSAPPNPIEPPNRVCICLRYGPSAIHLFSVELAVSTSGLIGCRSAVSTSMSTLAPRPGGGWWWAGCTDWPGSAQLCDPGEAEDSVMPYLECCGSIFFKFFNCRC